MTSIERDDDSGVVDRRHTSRTGCIRCTAGSTSGVLTIYVIAGASSPSPPCGTARAGRRSGTATVDNGNVTYQSNGAATRRRRQHVLVVRELQRRLFEQAAALALQPGDDDDEGACEQVDTRRSPSARRRRRRPAFRSTARSSPRRSSNSSPGATGTIHIKYVAAASAPSPCPAGTELGTASATGNGKYSQANPFPASTGGTYWWWATYDGDSANNAATSACGSTMPSTAVGAGPSLVSMTMKDTNGNGKVDQVVATFDKTLGSCTAPCTTAGP